MENLKRAVKDMVLLATRLIPDSLYLRLIYRRATGCTLRLNPPVNYNEKLQWLKLHDRKPHYSRMVDKYEAKKYIAERVGEEYTVPTYGVWNSFEEIDFSQLPEQFVLKTTHDSASYVICRDKAALDIEAARRKLTRCLKRNHYYAGREWPYKNVPPRIIAEKYLEDSQLHELRDYKFFTFHGEPKIMHLVSNRQNPDEETYGDFYDMDFGHLDVTMMHNNAPVPPAKPVNFEKMKEFAAKLSEGTRHLRVDFYEVDGQLYLGELTFFQDCGYIDVQPPHWNDVIGSWIRLD